SQIYHAALARDERQRAAFLMDACADDDALRHEVASLLDQKNGEGFLKAPAFEMAANVSAEDHGQSPARRQGVDRKPRSRAPGWFSFCAASFLGYFGLVMFSTFYPPAMGIGGSENARADGLIVTRVDADCEAERAGVQPGDRLVAIDGRRLRNLREQRA